MPNWCYTSYVAVGEESEIRALYDNMVALKEMSDSLVDNGFGKTWLGNLVTRLGGDWNKVRCRGSYDNVEIEGNELRFTTESAWCEPYETIDFIKGVYPNIQFYYMAEEPGMRYFVTNDASGMYFQERYCFERPGVCESSYYSDAEIEAFLQDVSDFLGRDINSADEAQDAICKYSSDKEWDDFADVKIFQVIQ